MRVFPRGFCSLLERRPVAVRAQGGPLLVAVLLGRGALVGVAVRRLLNGDVEPVTALAVGEGQHHTLGQQVILLRGHTLEYAVDHRHGLGAGDALVGTEALPPADSALPVKFHWLPIYCHIVPGHLPLPVPA